jgi:predicted regulator of Ras-like GTPase activity (Roadblock/LC7/MglB family)
MSTLAKDIRVKISSILKEEEQKTDLENLAVLSRVGMKVSTATSTDLDADTTSASTTALIDLGVRLSEHTQHGGLKEILLHNASGYSLLMAINDDYVVFSGLSKVHRVGYYLGYLRELTRRLNKLISGDEKTEMSISMEEEEREKFEEELQKEKQTIKPSIEHDKRALDDLLGFLDDWEQEDEAFEDLEAENVGNIVSIPKSIGISVEQEAATGEISSKTTSQKTFKVYDDEIPPIPLDDYTPMQVEEEQISEPQSSEFSAETQPTQTEELPPLDELPSLDELSEPDFESEFAATEYDTEFILEEESESLDNVLKELGWDEED